MSGQPHHVGQWRRGDYSGRSPVGVRASCRVIHDSGLRVIHGPVSPSKQAKICSLFCRFMLQKIDKG